LCLDCCFYSLYTHPSSTLINSSTSVSATFCTRCILLYCLFYPSVESCFFLLKTAFLNCSRVDVYLNYCILCILHSFCNAARVQRACCLSLSTSLCYRPIAASSLLRLPGSGAAALLPFSSPYPFLLPSTGLPLLPFFLPATSTVFTFCLLCCTPERAALCFPTACPSDPASDFYGFGGSAPVYCLLLFIHLLRACSLPLSYLPTRLRPIDNARRAHRPPPFTLTTGFGGFTRAWGVFFLYFIAQLAFGPERKLPPLLLYSFY
jgi:hypothetical protein